MLSVDEAKAGARTVALAERIMAALPAAANASREQRLPLRPTSSSTDRMPPRAWSSAARLRMIGAGSLLAASLAVGVVAGVVGRDSAVVNAVSDRLGVVDLVKGEQAWLDTTGHEEEDVL